MLSKAVLEETIGEATDLVRSREEDLNGARIRLAEAERELSLLAELAEMRGLDVPETTRGGGSGESGEGPQESRTVSRTPSRSRASLLSAVIEILEEHREPMQIRDLMVAVKARNVPIPGKGQQANLIAHVSRDERIVRPQRGFYALRELGFSDAQPAKRRRARRRSRSKA